MFRGQYVIGNPDFFFKIKKKFVFVIFVYKKLIRNTAKYIWDS